MWVTAYWTEFEWSWSSNPILKMICKHCLIQISRDRQSDAGQKTWVIWKSAFAQNSTKHNGGKYEQIINDGFTAKVPLYIFF